MPGVRRVTAKHFVSSAVRADQRARRVTVVDCSSESPVGEHGGYRRQSFIVYGQQVLFYRCHSEAGMNDFAAGLLAAGPNVFLNCDAKGSLGASGSFEGWASGVLYERVHVPDARLQIIHDQGARTGRGAGRLPTRSSGTRLRRRVDAIGPPGSQNYKVESAQPLYERELAARGLHLPAVSPARETASSAHVTEFHAGPEPAASEPAQHPFDIVNGRFVVDGKVVWGRVAERGVVARRYFATRRRAQSTGSSISRFMPGQVGPGLTEDLGEFCRQA